MTTVGHQAALRKLDNCLPKSGEAKAAAMVGVVSSSLYCGKHGLERGSNFLLVLFGHRLTVVRPTRSPDPKAVLLDFAKGTYRISDVERGSLNATFSLARPYGAVRLRMSRWGWYSINDQVLDRLVAAAAQAERAAARTPTAPLQTAGDVRVFARMCAAFGPGAEKATAVAEVEVLGESNRGLLDGRRPSALLATFPDRLVLLDGGATTHVPATPLASFAKSATAVTPGEHTAKHLEVGLTSGGRETRIRVELYGEERIDSLLVDAVLGAGG
ncbi:MAG: hypothetical protein ACT4QG_15530 [Sporichthyaceae bacterium]